MILQILRAFCPSNNLNCETDVSLKSLVNDPKSLTEFSDTLQGLANSHRLAIISRLQDREMSVGDLAKDLEISPSSLSRHLAKLKEAGFVTIRSDGKNRIYAANKHAIAYFATRLRVLLNNSTR
ncbi:ArsR/SmtB family transcription factor [Brucella pseudogrignonensis]|uniref:ArsR/SmtB family transcription factor n=1 Tax=Brucella pseudogrignonensis TaxID=419475 RepID=UPI0038D111C6